MRRARREVRRCRKLRRRHEESSHAQVPLHQKIVDGAGVGLRVENCIAYAGRALSFAAVLVEALKSAIDKAPKHREKYYGSDNNLEWSGEHILKAVSHRQEQPRV